MTPDNPGDLPEGARRLLEGPVDSFEKLEVLLALREVGGAPLTLASLASRAFSQVEQTERAIAELAAVGLVERLPDGTWRAGRAKAEALEELATAWTTCRPAVLKAMTGRAVGRIRASAARTFAEAFRVRGRKDDGGKDG